VMATLIMTTVVATATAITIIDGRPDTVVV